MLTRSPRSRPKSKSPAPSRSVGTAKRTASARKAPPEWNLADLYPAIDAPEIRRDLDLARAEAVTFETAYKGRLIEHAQQPDAGRLLTEAIKRFEALDDLIGRLMSFASLVHAGDTTDPVRTKFFGDVQDELTAVSLHLLFFTLELNRIDNDVLEAALADPELRHFRPFIEVVRLEKP
ncbi:MAG: M3 family oligoendopeptidase, partial [Rhodoplanes sp.]